MKDPIDTAIDLDSVDEAEDLQQGLTPAHRQNIDEARIDEVLVEDSLDSTDYPDIHDIADEDAVSQSHEDE